MSPIRVLVVDDSATMRGLISAALRRDPDIVVVGEAADPLQAREAIKALNPDVLTLDIEMPNMDGLEFLEKIMRLRPMPVVMVSTLTQAGAEASIRALELGAVDCAAKPTCSGSGALPELPLRVKAAARANVRPRAEPAPRKPARGGYAPSSDIVAIGSSTGGVEALLTLLDTFPETCPPTIITQHMPAAFTKSFAARLNRSCAAYVEEARDGAPVEPGRIYVAPGGGAHLEVSGTGALRCRLREGEPINGHRPSVDVLFESVARAAGAAAVGVLLTGMGRDGAKGLLAMRRAGARTLGQDEASSVVYGMPKAAVELGAVERQAPIGDLGALVLSLCEKKH
jgi:two-component system chemotaxis response regulator CheB